jgi:hypothetical protein
MRTFSFWSLVLLVCVTVAGCSTAPTSPSAALSGVSSEGLVSSEGQGPLSTRTLDEASIATAKPTPKPKATNLNLKGIVSAVDADDLTITVSSKVISVPETATIIDALGAALTFDDILVSKRVHVTGKTLSGVSTASVVRVLDFAITGTVSTLAGTCPTVTFAIDTQNVATTATTAFQYGDCSKLADDMQVEVQGTLDAGLLTALKVVLPKVAPPKPVKNVRLKGAASLLSGSCPAKIFTVNGQEVRASAATTFTGSGKCAAIANGKTVDVTGVQETGYIRAVRINVSKK